MQAGAGQLWVKLIGATGVPAVDGDSSDPIVTLYVGNGEKVKTKPIPRNLHPIVRIRSRVLGLRPLNSILSPQPSIRWNEEFVLSVPNKSSHLVIDLKDYNKVFSNKAIGIARLDVANLPNDQICDIKLQLPEFPATEISLNVRYSPIGIISKRPIAKKLPDFRMQLERTTYFPGEIIRGHVLFNVGKPKKIRAVRVKFEGYSKTEFNTGDSNPDQRSSVKNTYAKVVWFNPIATLAGSPRGSNAQFPIGSKTWIWPFTFCLPTNIPPSYRHNWGMNYYEVAAYVDVPWKKDLVVKQPLRVCIQYSSLKFEPTLKTSKKTKGTIFSDSGNIIVQASTKDIGYIGEDHYVNVTVVNQTKKALKELKVDLWCKQTFYAGDKFGGRYYGDKLHNRKKDNRRLVASKITQPGFPIPPGGQWQGSVGVTVPRDTPPSMPRSMSPLIEIKYILEVEAVSKGNIFTKSRAGTEFFLMIGMRNPAELQHIVAPSAPMAQPYVVQVVKVDAITPAFQPYIPPPPITAEATIDQSVFVGNVMPAAAFQQNIYKPDQYIEQDDADNVMAQMMAKQGDAPPMVAPPQQPGPAPIGHSYSTPALQPPPPHGSSAIPPRHHQQQPSHGGGGYPPPSSPGGPLPQAHSSPELYQQQQVHGGGAPPQPYAPTAQHGYASPPPNNGGGQYGTPPQHYQQHQQYPPYQQQHSSPALTQQPPQSNYGPMPPKDSPHQRQQSSYALNGGYPPSPNHYPQASGSTPDISQYQPGGAPSSPYLPPMGPPESNYGSLPPSREYNSPQGPPQSNYGSMPSGGH